MSVASPSLPAAAVLQAQSGTRELWFRRVLTVFCVVAGLGILAHLGVLLWGQNEFTLPESVVAGQSMMLAHGGTLYYSLRDYPYTVNAYMPLFYLLDAGLIRLTIPAFVAGRLISFAALLGIYSVSWRVLMLYTGRLYCAWLGTLLCVSTSLLLSWGTVGQVDTLAVCLALTGFYYYAQHRLIQAGAFVILAVLTKQTMLAAPAGRAGRDLCLSVLRKLENRPALRSKRRGRHSGSRDRLECCDAWQLSREHGIRKPESLRY
jgi:hypothetical protein